MAAITSKKRLDFFPVDLHFAFGPKGAKRLHKKLEHPARPGRDWAGSVTKAYNPHNGSLALIVYINASNHLHFVDLLNTIQHEAYHVYAAMVEHLEMSPDEETTAYLVSGISEVIYREVAAHSDTSFELPDS